jgi:hypothetical protein
MQPAKRSVAARRASSGTKNATTIPAIDSIWTGAKVGQNLMNFSSVRKNQPIE